MLETLNDIGASEYLGVQTLTLSIFTTWLNRGSLAGAAQMACLLLLIVAALIGLERYGRQRRAFTALGTDGRLASRIALAGPERWIAACACFLPVVLGFLLPAGYLLREVIGRGLLAGFDTNLVRYTLTTVALASTATAITLVMGFLAVLALRYTKRPTIAGCVNIAGIGYAIPGTVLALGLLSPLVLVDDAISRLDPGLHRPRDRSPPDRFGRRSRHRLCDSVPRDSHRLRTSRVFPRPHRTRRRGTPARRGGRNAGAHDPSAPGTAGDLGAALLVFVDCLKELPATLLLRPLNVETLSTYIYQFATRGSFEQGSLAALIIVAVGILPVIRITRYTDAATLHDGVRP